MRRLFFPAPPSAVATSFAVTSPLACLGNPYPVGMKIYAHFGEEAFDDVETMEEAQAGADRREAVDAGAMLNAGKDLSAVLQAREISEATLAARGPSRFLCL